MSPSEREYSLQDQRNARAILLPTVTTLFLAEALGEAPSVPKTGERLCFPYNSTLDQLNFCPAISSTYSIFQAAKSALSEATKLEKILTSKQKKTLEKTIDWTAVDPDHHFKNNFMTSYPAFALGFMHESIYAGDVPKPETVNEVLGLLQDPNLDSLLWEGMFTASGVMWNQVALTPPWGVFKNLRDLYDYGNKSPFLANPDGSRSFKPTIKARLRDRMREVNQGGERVAVRCPIAVRSIHGVSSDPASSAFLSDEQIGGLISSDRKSGKPLAVKDDKEVIHIQFDALAELRRYFTDFTQRTIADSGVPVVTEYRNWPHEHTVVFVDPSIPVPPTSKPESKPDCPKNAEYNTRRYKMPCACAA